MTNPEAFYTIQLTLEGLRFDGLGHLERFKDMPGESGPPPRVVALKSRGCRRVYISASVDPGVESRVRHLPFAKVWTGDDDLRKALSLTQEDQGRMEYWTYTPSRRLPVRVDSLAQRVSSTDERLRYFSKGFFSIDYPDVYVVLAEGMVVAAAASSREDEQSAEAWVFVNPAFRQRGLAGHVTRAWLYGTQERGLIPFYSHVPENVASCRLARSLRLKLRFVLACYV